MPYKLKKVKGGYKVAKKDGSKTFSKKPMSKEKAKAQMAAIYANESLTFEQKVDKILNEMAEYHYEYDFYTIPNAKRAATFVNEVNKFKRGQAIARGNFVEVISKSPVAASMLENDLVDAGFRFKRGELRFPYRDPRTQEFKDQIEQN